MLSAHCIMDNLHCDCDEEHVRSFEDSVASVTQPDIVSEAHEKDTPCTYGRENTQRELAPHPPLDSDITHRERCSCT